MYSPFVFPCFGAKSTLCCRAQSSWRSTNTHRPLTSSFAFEAAHHSAMMQCIFEPEQVLPAKYVEMMVSYLEENHLQEIVDLLQELDCATSKHYGLPIRRARCPSGISSRQD